MKIDKALEIIERVYSLAGTSLDPMLKSSDSEWSVIEIVGHLADSAGNNIQRLLRYVPQGELTFPGYDQELFVKRAGYQKFDFNMLLDLWYRLNRLFIHIYANIPEADRTSRIKLGDRPAITIEQLFADYFEHMENHERQIRGVIGNSFH